MDLQLLVEIEHVAMGVALSQNGNKPEYICLQAEAFAISFNKCLGRNLGGAIEGSLHRDRRSFRGGENLRLSIYGTGGGIGDAADSVVAHGLQYIDGGNGVLFQILAGAVRPETHIGIGREVEDKLATAHSAG